MLLLPEREHDGFPVPVPAVPRVPAVSELLLARPRQRPPQQPAPDEGALVLGEEDHWLGFRARLCPLQHELDLKSMIGVTFICGVILKGSFQFEVWLDLF